MALKDCYIKEKEKVVTAVKSSFLCVIVVAFICNSYAESNFTRFTLVEQA